MAASSHARPLPLLTCLLQAAACGDDATTDDVADATAPDTLIPLQGGDTAQAQIDSKAPATAVIKGVHTGKLSQGGL